MGGLRAQFHGAAGPSRTPAPSSSASAAPGPAPLAPASAARHAASARGSNTNTTPPFRDAAATGSGADGRAPGTRQAPGTSTGASLSVPRGPQAGGRAPATSRLNLNKLRGGRVLRPPTRLTRLTFFFFSPSLARYPTRREGAFTPLNTKVALALIAAHSGEPPPRPLPSWRQTELTNQEANFSSPPNDS